MDELNLGNSGIQNTWYLLTPGETRGQAGQPGDTGVPGATGVPGDTGLPGARVVIEKFVWSVTGPGPTKTLLRKLWKQEKKRLLVRNKKTNNLSFFI